jgi:hypothetical protein
MSSISSPLSLSLSLPSDPLSSLPRVGSSRRETSNPYSRNEASTSSALPLLTATAAIDVTASNSGA